MRALCLLRPQIHYRREAFAAGLRTAGFTVRMQEQMFTDPRPEDCLVIWNRYGTGEEMARRFERVGAAVFVVENGYIGEDDKGEQYYALARNNHVGAGKWHGRREGEDPRFPSLGVKLLPFREPSDDGDIVVMPQRGIGPNGVAMPPGWDKDAQHIAERLTTRRVRIRPHPGNHEPAIPLEVDLENAHAVIVWASSAGVKALALGVPVFTAYSRWLMAMAATAFPPPWPATPDTSILDKVNRDEAIRTAAFERLAWAQWTIDEIATGYPFLRNLGRA